MVRLKMKNYNKILTENQQKYRCYHQVRLMKCDEILLSDQSKIIKQAKFIYSPFGKAFEKQMETVENQGIKQCEALKAKR